MRHGKNIAGALPTRDAGANLRQIVRDGVHPTGAHMTYFRAVREPAPDKRAHVAGGLVVFCFAPVLVVSAVVWALWRLLTDWRPWR